MPNVLDLEPVRAFARRAATKIADERIAERFERLAIARLLQDHRNFRAATPAELESAPAWTRRALARGETICAFKLHRGAGQCLHNLARRLEDTRRLAGLDVSERPNSLAYVTAARAFIGKLERADFETTRRRAYDFARLFTACSEAEDDRQVCAAQTLPMPGARLWMRVTSVSELRAVGREFCNCLARTTRTSNYGGGLYRGERQFWVLRGDDGAGRIVVMADAPQATGLMEVRGPHNARIAACDLDLKRLSRALGIRPPPPPPSPPPGAAIALLLARLERERSRPPSPLRAAAGAP